MTRSPHHQKNAWAWGASWLTPAIVVLAIASHAPGQEATSGRPATLPISQEELQSRIDRLRQANPAPDSPQGRALDLYTQAMERLALAQDWLSKIEQYRDEIDEAPGRLRAIQQQLAEPPQEVELTLAADTDLAEANQRLAEQQARLDAARAALNELQAESATRVERRRQIPEQLAATRQRLTEIAGEAAAAAATDEPAEVTEARRLLLQIRRRMREAEVSALELELTSYDARSSLLTARTDLARRNVTQNEKRLEQLRNEIEGLRRSVAVQAQARARRANEVAATAHPLIRQVAQSHASDIQALADRLAGREGLPARIREVNARLQQVQQLTLTLQEQYAELETRAAAAGRSSAVGRLLRRRVAELPDTGRLQRNIRSRENTLAEIDFERIELEDERAATGDVAAIVAETKAELTEAVSEETLAEIEATLVELLNAKKDTLDNVLESYDTYSDIIFNLNTEAAELIAQTEQMEEFVGERVLWIRSGTPIGLSTIRESAAPIAWFLSPENWAGFFESVWYDLRRHPIANGIIALVVLVLGLVRPRTKNRIQAAGIQANKGATASFQPTVAAMLFTIVSAAFWPVLFLAVWWHLEQNIYVDTFSRAIGQGALAAALVLVCLELLRQIVRPDGIAEAHFQWPRPPVTNIRRNLLWFEIVSAVCVFILAALRASNEEYWNEALGRITFIAEMIALFVFALLLFRGKRKSVSKITESSFPAATRAFKRYGRVGVLAIPLILVGMACAGYTYTAMRLGWRVYITACLLVVLVLARGLIIRWLSVARRRLAMEQARKKRRAKKKAGQEPEPDLMEHIIDLSAVNTQSDRLLRSVLALTLLLGLWFVWADVIPAIAALDQVEIWTVTTTVTETGEDGQIDSRSVETPITLKHLVLAILVALFTFAAVRNIPGILEIALLQRLKLPAGERHAITTIVRYTITIIGAFFVLDAVGLSWSKLQWLVAALGLGLGFGLQEIFANFISGIILLFERPIRVGDVVTVGDISGTVTRIRIRATTITDWDRKELVVPNKSFITGQLVNWTLSDSVLRVLVPVGIAYGSDTQKAVDILFKVVRESPHAVSDPEPLVFFMGFGDSSLQFELRAYCQNLENFLPLRHDLHMRIDREFRAAGIEIAFPQRDIHVRSIRQALPLTTPQQVQEDQLLRQALEPLHVAEEGQHDQRGRAHDPE